MKRMVSCLLAMLMVLSLAACSDNNNSKNNFETEETINFDLSQYKDHGELSDGRIWVIKETSSWDTDPYESYAYLDCNGNVIYGWDFVNKKFHNGIYSSGYIRATNPCDFNNGFALIYDDSSVDVLGGYANAKIIDKSGNQIATFLISSHKKSIGSSEIVMSYEDFNSEGYAFFVGKKDYSGEFGMFFVNDSGVHKFHSNEDTIISRGTLEDIDVVNDKYFYVSGGNSQLFDLNGNMVMDIGESSGINPKSIEIINDTYIEASFTGKDGKTHICVLDFYGNIIKSPVLYSEYKRDNKLLQSNKTSVSSTATTTAASVKYAIPNLVGQNYYDIRNEMFNGDFVIVNEMLVYSEKPEGTILSQTPTAGASADKGSTINVVISLGSRKETVPAMTPGEYPNSVRFRLEEMGFKVIEVLESNDTVEAGKVIRIDSEPQSQVEYGSEVRMYVSAGSFD